MNKAMLKVYYDICLDFKQKVQDKAWEYVVSHKTDSDLYEAWAYLEDYLEDVTRQIAIIRDLLEKGA